jgi:hypothetical protein
LEEPQVEHPLPVMAEVAPLESFEKDANLESTRLDTFLHCGQSAVSLDWLKRHNFSNFFRQSLQ